MQFILTIFVRRNVTRVESFFCKSKNVKSYYNGCIKSLREVVNFFKGRHNIILYVLTKDENQGLCREDFKNLKNVQSLLSL